MHLLYDSFHIIHILHSVYWVKHAINCYEKNNSSPFAKDQKIALSLWLQKQYVENLYYAKRFTLNANINTTIKTQKKP
jgi:hypothetical protein